MIVSQHIHLYNEIVSLPGFLTEPILSFGYHDVIWHERLARQLETHRAEKKDLRIFLNMRPELAEMCDSKAYAVDVPWQFIEMNFNQILRNYGMSDITVLDFFDERADIKHDMNLPIADHLKGQFNTIVDIGSVEHVFDTKQCLDNLFQMLRVGGHIMFHLPCSGYFDHGFYTFSPEVIIDSLRLNGFKIIYLAFSLEPEGMKLEKPVDWNNCLMWCAACKIKEQKQFVIPQQNSCKAMYGIEPLKSVLTDFETKKTSSVSRSPTK